MSGSRSSIHIPYTLCSKRVERLHLNGGFVIFNPLAHCCLSDSCSNGTKIIPFTGLQLLKSIQKYLMQSTPCYFFWFLRVSIHIVLGIKRLNHWFQNIAGALLVANGCPQLTFVTISSFQSWVKGWKKLYLLCIKRLIFCSFYQTKTTTTTLFFNRLCIGTAVAVNILQPR